MLSGITSDEPVRPGHGEGSFVVIRGRKKEAGRDGKRKDERGQYEERRVP